MGKKSKHYQIKSKDEETVVYGSFPLADLKMLANALMDDLNNSKKNDEWKAKNTLLKRIRRLIED